MTPAAVLIHGGVSLCGDRDGQQIAHPVRDWHVEACAPIPRLLSGHGPVGRVTLPFDAERQALATRISQVLADAERQITNPRPVR